MKKLFFSIALLSLLSCSNSDDPVCCTNIDINVSIKYLNEEGQNLIDLGEVTESSIEIYHKIDGEWVRYYDGNLTNPKGIRFDEREEGSYLTVFPSTTRDEEGISETKIAFSSSDEDILTTAIDKSGNNEIVTKVWYNNSLKWEALESERTIEVVK